MRRAFHRFAKLAVGRPDRPPDSGATPRRNRGGRVALVLAIVCASSCVTPSIPIPPPAPERMTFGIDTTAGTSTFSYPPESNYADAIVYVFNRTVGQGVITTARADGSVAETPPFPAQYGDEVAVTIEAEAQAVSTCVVLRSTGPSESCNF